MADKFKFEIIILVCSCLTGVICSELISAKNLSTTSLLGSTTLTAILLFVMALFTTTSIHGIEDKKTRKKTKSFYIKMGIIPLVAMLLLIVFKAEPITFWVISCILWYLASAIRIAVLWDWF